MRKIKAEELERYCARYGQNLVLAIQERFPAVDGIHQVPVDDWFAMARAARRSLGLGDVVAAIAQPIAKAIDAVAHTNIQNCGGCKKRRAALNRIHL
jgi:hypothetical protein